MTPYRVLKESKEVLFHFLNPSNSQSETLALRKDFSDHKGRIMKDASFFK